VNRLRIALAHELVTASQLSIELVAERAGFASARQFRRAWNRLHAISPSRLRQAHSVH
jgi:transcriptional regulator GlxA family with amidase domain